MTFLGFELRRQTKAAASTLSPVVDSRGGWWPIIREGFAGAWQRGITLETENVLAFSAVYACVTLIASDIAKLQVKLVEEGADDIWRETESPAFSPVLRKPNHYQNRIQFYLTWLCSKLIHGNTYVLKVRDNRRVVTGLYVLDPTRVRPLVAPDGSVFYALNQDNLSLLTGESSLVVPASEMIHDIMIPLYHPLCGVSPISACGLAAVQGMRIQEHSTRLFGNGAMPSGILMSPGMLDDDQVADLQDKWQKGFTGENSGKVAVLGGGMTYTMLSMNSVDAQLIEQLRWTAENVCQAFRVPPFMIGVGPAPAYNNIEALNQQYYTQCLQIHVESIELLLDEGLQLVGGTGPKLGTEFDLDDLLRMDTAARIKAGAEAIGSALMSPNEARFRFADLGRVEGGATPYLQQQNYSLAALAKRDQSADPFASKTPAATSSAPPVPPPAAKALELNVDDAMLAQCLERKAIELGL